MGKHLVMSLVLALAAVAVVAGSDVARPVARFVEPGPAAVKVERAS